MNGLKVGNLVRLKSGGPLLTVTAVDGDTVTCQWFDDKKLGVATFPKDTLVLEDGSSVVF